MPKDSSSLALKQPDTIQTHLEISGDGHSARTEKQRADVIPEKGILGTQYALIHVLPYFENKICSRFANRNNDAFGPTKFQIWGCCLQGKCLNKGVIIKASYPSDVDKILASFTETIQFYLERVSGVNYLGNFIIRIICTNNKPVLVLIECYIAQRNDIECHIDDP